MCTSRHPCTLLLHKADSEEVAKPQEAVDPKLAKALAKREKAKAAKAKRKAEADAKAQAEAAKEAAKNDDSKKKLPKRDADEDPKGEKIGRAGTAQGGDAAIEGPREVRGGVGRDARFSFRRVYGPRQAVVGAPRVATTIKTDQRAFVVRLRGCRKRGRR